MDDGFAAPILPWLKLKKNKYFAAPFFLEAPIFYIFSSRRSIFFLETLSAPPPPPSLKITLVLRFAPRVNGHCAYTACGVNPLTAKLFNLNFHPLEVVSRWRDPQLQVSENYSDLAKWMSTVFKYCWLAKWRSTVFKYCWLMSHFIFVTCFKGGT